MPKDRVNAWLLLRDDEVYKEDLRQQDQGEADPELLVPGLVVEEVHAEKCPYAASDDGQQDERILGNAPPTFFGLPFVHAVDQEGQDIDNDKVNDHTVSNVAIIRYTAKCLPVTD